jgi:L-alanine-DL-glutamate epimerase-like enolase superfamily enzyme
MKITDLRTHVLFDGWRNLVFVELETDAGITGLGEATLANRTEAVVAYLHAAREKHVVGSDPFDTEALWRRIYLGDFIRGGMIACAGLSAIDIACHDIRPGRSACRFTNCWAARFARRFPATQRLVHGRADARGHRRAGAAGGRARLPWA